MRNAAIELAHFIPMLPPDFVSLALVSVMARGSA